MKSLALQKLVNNIFNDENTKKEFLADPESVVSRYKLTKEEKSAVLSTHARLGLVTGNSQQVAVDIEPFVTWI